MDLVAEIFDRLEIEETIHGLAVGVGVALVHLAAEFRAPFGNGEGEPDIDDNGRERDRRKQRAEEIPEEPGEDDELDDGRRDVEEREADQELDALDAAVDDARQPAGAPLEMEAQRKRVQMLEGDEGHAPHGILAHGRREVVADLREDDLQHAPEREGQHKADDELERGARLERIDRAAEVDGRHDGRDLGDEERQEREHGAAFQVAAAARPEIGRERFERPQDPPSFWPVGEKRRTLHEMHLTDHGAIIGDASARGKALAAHGLGSGMGKGSIARVASAA